MAITQAKLTDGGSGTDATSYATASVTPGANRLIVVAVLNSKSTTPDTPTLSGNGLTYVQIATVTFQTIASPQKRLTLFRAMGASPSAGAITIDMGGVTQSGCAWSVSEFDGVDTSGTDGSGAVVQSATNSVDSSGSLDVTLAAYGDGTNHAAYGAFGANSTEVQNAEAGWTEISEATHATPSTVLHTVWLLGPGADVTVHNDSATTTLRRGGIAIEIKVAAVAGGQPTAKRWEHVWLPGTLRKVG